MSRRRRVWAGAAALLGLQAGLLVAWLAVEAGRDAPAPSPRAARVYETLDAPAADLTYRDAGGRTRRLSQHRGGPVLVHLWATWCGPCVDELPALLAWTREDGVPLLALSVDDAWADVEAFFDGRVPAAVAWAGPAGLAWEGGGLPQTWALDADGRARLRLPGARDWRDPAERARVRAALEAAPGR